MITNVSDVTKAREAKPIDVLVIDDSALVRQVMTDVLSQAGSIAVRSAADPIIAMEVMKFARPDVIILDLMMPRMDGMTFLRKLMAEDPLPVVICSELAARGTEAAMQALEEGAVEVVAKPKLGISNFIEESATMLIDTVRAASRSRIRQRQPSFAAPPRPYIPEIKPPPLSPSATRKVIAIGASTGGTDAIQEMLESLPEYAPGIVVVQHMPELFTAAFAQRLNRTCTIEVKEAVDGDQVRPGRALIAPGNRHLLVRRNGAGYKVEIAGGPLVNRHRPSIDVLFRSVAQAARANGLGVILTGMGSDGADGLLEMKRAGAITIAQDEASCTVFGMPKEAIARGAVDTVLPLDKIAGMLLRKA